MKSRAPGKALRRALAAALFAAALGPLTLGCKRGSATHEGSSHSSPAELSWPLRQRLHYQLELASQSVMSMTDMPFKLEVKAGVDLIPIEANAGRTALLMRLSDPQVTFDKQRSPETAPLEAELSKPFWFALEAGRIVHSRIAAGISAQAVSFLRTISSSFQLAVPKTQNGATWEATELDATGQYQAKYEVGADGVAKHKLRFLDTLVTGKSTPAQRGKVLPEVLKSNGTLQIARGLLQKVTLNDELRSTLLGSNVVTVTTQLSLVRDAGEPAAADADALIVNGDLTPLPPSQAFGVADMRTQFDAVRAAGANFKDVLAGLEAIGRAPEESPQLAAINDTPVDDKQQTSAKVELEQRAALLTKLVGLLRIQPETVAQSQAAILAKSPAATMLADGLSTADSPAAQAALVSLLGDARLPEKLRPQLATSLIRVHTPTAETVSFLRGMLHDAKLQDYAVYGSGTAARRLAESGMSARSASIVDDLLHGLAAASAPVDRIRWLRGIANSASPKALPALEPLLKDLDDSVRQAAVDALRLIQDPSVDAILEARLRDEQDPGVRRALLRVAERRPVDDTLANAVTRVAKSDPDATVRRAALQLLEQWLPKRESLRATVDELKQAAAKIATDTH